LNSLSQELYDQCIEQFEQLFSFLDTGVIYQIGIPRDLVGRLVYLSKYGGRLYFEDPNPYHQADYIMNALKESKEQPSFKNNKYQTQILCDLHTLLNPRSSVLIVTYSLPSQQKQFDDSCKVFKEFVWDQLSTQ
jgi:hypothetical protein